MTEGAYEKLWNAVRLRDEENMDAAHDLGGGAGVLRSFHHNHGAAFFRSGGAAFTATDADGKEITQFLTAGEQYRLRVEGARALSGQPMDEAFFQTAQETIPLDKDYFDKESYFFLIDPSYRDFYTEFGEWLNGTAEHYYTARQNGRELSWQRLTEEDAAYWRELEARVEKPFVYQPVLGPRMLMNMLGWMWIRQ